MVLRTICVVAAVIGIVPLWAVDAPVRATERVAAIYPANLKDQRVIGIAEVSCLIAESGAVGELKVEAQSRPEFGEAALQALRQWKFRPGESGGKPTAARVTVPFSFIPSDAELEELEARRTPEALMPGPPVLDAGELSEMPNLKREVKPAVPRGLRQWMVENAVVRFIVDENGRPRDIHILVTTEPACGQLALEAVRQWKFSPGKIEGRIVRVAMEVPISFFPNNRRDSGARVRPGVSRDFVTSYKGHPIESFHGAADETMPKATKKEELDYPEDMEDIRAGGEILVECIINPYGVVTHVRALNPQNQFFAIAAERAFSRWKFSPPMKGGKPVYYRGTMRASFYSR